MTNDQRYSACLTCGALIADVHAHDQWHTDLLRIIAHRIDPWRAEVDARLRRTNERVEAMVAHLQER